VTNPRPTDGREMTRQTTSNRCREISSHALDKASVYGYGPGEASDRIVYIVEFGEKFETPNGTAFHVGPDAVGVAPSEKGGWVVMTFYRLTPNHTKSLSLERPGLAVKPGRAASERLRKRGTLRHRKSEKARR